MAYPAGYWAELVRSSSSTSFSPSASGAFVWLRTSDGEPLEQETRYRGSWIAQTGDTDEPDRLPTIGRPWRCRKAGEAWLPSDAGIAWATTIDFAAGDQNPAVSVNTVAGAPWPVNGVYRFFEQPVAPSWTATGGPAITGVSGADISPVTVPVVDAGTPAPAYTAAGLPTGLAFNANTRVISCLLYTSPSPRDS